MLLEQYKELIAGALDLKSKCKIIRRIVLP